MQHEPVRRFAEQTVHPLLIARRAERHRTQRLCLAPRKEGRAVYPRQDADATGDIPKLVDGTAVEPFSLEEQVADDAFLERVERLLELQAGPTLGVDQCCLRKQFGSQSRLDFIRGGVPFLLLGILLRVLEPIVDSRFQYLQEWVRRRRFKRRGRDAGLGDEFFL